MEKAHIEQIRKKLEHSKWIIQEIYSELDTMPYWKICRPNGDHPLILEFMLSGNGKYGALRGDESFYNAIACHIKEYPEIDLYFGKYSGQFQKDLAAFITTLNHYF